MYIYIYIYIYISYIFHLKVKKSLYVLRVSCNSRYNLQPTNKLYRNGTIQ